MRSFELRNGKNLIIREAKQEDSLEYINYINQVADETNFLTFGVGELLTAQVEQESMIKNSAKSDNRLMIFAIVDGKIVGNLNFRSSDRPRIRHTGEFGITVLTEFWGFGIGSHLVSYLIKWAKESKIIRKINLEVRIDNRRAIELYSRLGFVEEGVIKRKFLIGDQFYSAIYMGMEID